MNIEINQPIQMCHQNLPEDLTSTQGVVSLSFFLMGMYFNGQPEIIAQQSYITLAIFRLPPPPP